jgi:hypothetical protein
MSRPIVTSFFNGYSIYYERCFLTSLVSLGLAESQSLLAYIYTLWVSSCSRQMEDASIHWLLFNTRYVHYSQQNPVVYGQKREPWMGNMIFNEIVIYKISWSLYKKYFQNYGYVRLQKPVVQLYIIFPDTVILLSNIQSWRFEFCIQLKNTIFHTSISMSRRSLHLTLNVTTSLCPLGLCNYVGNHIHICVVLFSYRRRWEDNIKIDLR